VYNIQKAVSRLDFAPNLKQIQITNIKKGIGIFTPKSDKPVSFTDLQTALKKAGYVLDSAELTVSGTLVRENNNWSLVSNPSGQRFALETTIDADKLAGREANEQLEITGAWKTTGSGSTRQETILPHTVTSVSGEKTTSVFAVVFLDRSSFNLRASITSRSLICLIWTRRLRRLRRLLHLFAPQVRD
jgi:hypothetical protein